ncbi:MAG: tyrosine-type recombinase/integrase [Acidimicrobiaceae bacterium]|nr:tyrosine-type recombinase/integrase [Acidimicrobiaceae bacterium]
MILLASEALEAFLAEYRGVQGRSVRATASQRNHLVATLTMVADVRGTTFDELELVNITREDLVKVLLTYRERPDQRFVTNPGAAPPERSNATMGRRISAVRTFFGWCTLTGRVYVDPAATILSPRRVEKSPEALTEIEARRLLAAASKSSWPLRDVAIVSLALGCGPRLTEIATAKLGGLEGSTSVTLTILGKGSKPRRLHLGTVPSQAMTAWLVERQAFLDAHHLKSDSLFLSSKPRRVTQASGKVTWECNFSTEGLADFFTRVTTAAGLSKPGVRAHVCRHTFATLALRSRSFDLRELQAALGHASLATMSRYLHVSDDDLAKAASQHPLSN